MSTAAVEQIVKPYHQTNRFSLFCGDCRIVLPIFPDNSFDSIVCDPPYELGFMGKGWDRSGIAYDVSVWRECLRVLKPGGHLLAFGGSRTYHRLACAIEDAGFEIRDQIQWIYGSGFPKSLDVPKAIDSGGRPEDIRRLTMGEDYEPSGRGRVNYDHGNGSAMNGATSTPVLSEAARQWIGWGTALKPAHEPIVLARKPLIGTVAENVLQHGTGGLNIDGCRIEGEYETRERDNEGGASMFGTGKGGGTFIPASGRWPSNIIHDGSEEVLAGFPETQSGDLTGQPRVENKIYGSAATTIGTPRFFTGDSGSAARFFYCAKASQEDRNEGCEDLPHRVADDVHKRPRTELDDPRRHGVTPRQNNHPTVKPTDLMRYLCRLVTPPGGVVLDPFCGSGSTGKAAMLEGFKFVGIELNEDYCQLAQRRIEAVTRQGLLFA